MKRLLMILSIAALAHADGENQSNKTFQQGTDFSSKSLVGANFKDSTLVKAKFNGADLKQAKFDGADLTNADFSPAGFYGFRTFTNLQSATFNGATLNGANFYKANMQNADLGRVTLKEGTSFEDANLSGANLRDVNITRSDLWPVIFKNANLTGAELPANVPPVMRRPGEVDVARITVWGEPWSEAQKETKFRGKTLINRDFKGKPGKGSFAGVDFSDANLTGAKFWKNTRIAQAKFDNAILDGTDFSSLKQDDLDRADFRNVSPAMLDKAKWPAQSELTTVLFKGGYKPNR